MEQAHQQAHLAELAEQQVQAIWSHPHQDPLPLIEKVIQHHIKAAEYFLKAATSNDNPDLETSLVQGGHQQAIQTLQLLSAHHSKQAQEWKRRAQQVQVRAKEPAMASTIEKEPEDEPIQDPFNKFWDVVETLVSTDTPRTIAFTTAPLGKQTQAPKDTGSPKQTTSLLDASTHQMLQSYFVVPSGNQWASVAASTASMHPPPSPTSHKIADTFNHLSMHDKPPSLSKTLEEYKLENEQLKKMVDLLSKKLSVLEKAAQENQVLKSSIIRFRNDVQKQKKWNNSSLMMSAGPSTSLNDPMETSQDKIGLFQKRIQELELQVEVLKQEGEKKDAVLEKYRERWEKLKEAAKKKKQEETATE